MSISGAEILNMKKSIATASLAAISLASLNAANTPSGLTPQQTTKPWSVSAALRGFYDDNYTTVPDAFARSTWGMNVVPSIKFNFPLELTYIGLSYTYDGKYYERDAVWDHTHKFRFDLSHTFNETTKVDLFNDFVIAQEPEIIDSGTFVTIPLRTDGDNMRNWGGFRLTKQWSRQFSTVLGYMNRFYDYAQDAVDVRNDAVLGRPFGQGSRSALLDRVENRINLDLRWQALPQTVALVGYMFEDVGYTSDDPVAVNAAGVMVVKPSDRDRQSHFFFVGADQNFTSTLNASARVGAQLTDYQATGASDRTTPYADADITYTYMQGSYVQFGVRHGLNSTDIGVPSVTGGGVLPTLDQQSTSLYVSWYHKLTGKLSGRVWGQWQNSTFNGGLFDDSTDDYYAVSATLNYQLNQFLAAEVRYSYDKLDSGIPGRPYNRSRVFFGFIGSY